MKKNVTSGCILPSISGVLLKIHICHFTSIFLPMFILLRSVNN